MAAELDDGMRPVSLRGLLPGAATGPRRLTDWLRVPRREVARAAAVAGDEWTERLAALNAPDDNTPVFFTDYWAATNSSLA
ncbi:hypothetical protein ACFV1W_25375 [Kitasatospora sp. NPDC059648]|uniref:hypothetical protein n=1 Tax=Kitasatospora sp. NPDC059648 TaxID=3346894 RepID=UPI00368CDDEE